MYFKSQKKLFKTFILVNNTKIKFKTSSSYVIMLKVCDYIKHAAYSAYSREIVFRNISTQTVYCMNFQ